MSNSAQDLSHSSLVASDVAPTRPESKLCSRVLDTVELTATIFQFLKEATYKEAGIDGTKNGVPNLPAWWTQFFARLALVNRTFFHESVGVLWEKMHSAAPFFELLLPADRNNDGKVFDPLGYAVNVITPEHWRRFSEYSSRTRELTLCRPEAKEMNAGWLLHLAMSTSRPNPLFPALRHLVVTSTDSLSMMIAISSAPYSKLVTINLDGNSNEKDDEAAAAITSSICGPGSPNRLSELRVLHPPAYESYFVLMNISRSPSITSLEISIPRRSHHTDFPSLSRCRSLAKLVMTQVLPRSDNSAREPDLWPASVNLQDHIARAQSLPRLASLQVCSNALTHFLVAQKLGLRSLVFLKLEVKLDAFPDQLILLPHVLTIHATRNTSLTCLDVTCPGVKSIPSEAVASRRDDWQYINFTQLWTGLKGLQSLTTLKIIDVPFLCADILDRLLDVLCALPQLKVAALSPRRMTDLEADELSLPSLHRLEDVSRHNIHLVQLHIAMDLYEIPDVPREYISSSRLLKLKLSCKPSGSLTLDNFSNDELLYLGRYIDRIFPNLDSLAEGWKKDSKTWKLWDYMESLVHSFQDLRSQAVEDFRVGTENGMNVSGSS